MKSSPSANELVNELYTPRVEEARRRFAAEVTARLTDPSMSAAVLERFLIQFCATGVRMTEPVEGWIRRAGQRCQEVGLVALGRSLEKHAEHEADHHLMMIADTRHLVSGWNERRRPALDADTLLAAGPTPATDAYVELHEDVIASDSPFRQLSIEFEIERLSTTFGPPLMEQCKRLLGSGITDGLSFLVEHIEIDQGHTLFNERQLEKLLTHDPSFAEPLARTGAAALEAYRGFLEQCLAIAEVEQASARRVARDAGPHMVQA